MWIVLHLFLVVVIKQKSNSWDSRPFNPLSPKSDQWNKLRTYQSPLQTDLFFGATIQDKQDGGLTSMHENVPG